MLTTKGTTAFGPQLGVFPGEVEIRKLEKREEDERDEFVYASLWGTPFHLSAWQSLVEAVLGHQCFCLTARRENRISGVFPLARVRSLLFGDCLVSLPLAVYGGICADDSDSYFGLLKAGSQLAHRLGVQYLEMRNRTEPFPTALPGRDLYVTFTQDLTSGVQKLLQGLPRDTRYAVRKSQKAGLEWTNDLSERDFYEMFARSLHRLGTPTFSPRLFTRLRALFGKEARLFGVRKDKTAIAGVFCLYFRDRVMPYYGACLPEYYKDAPNNFMYWNLIEQSCLEGFRVFDFGRSKQGTGSFQFKAAWAMQISPLPYRYHLVRAQEVPHLSPIDKKFQLLTSAWKRLPFPLTKIIGPKLLRWIPSV